MNLLKPNKKKKNCVNVIHMKAMASTTYESSTKPSVPNVTKRKYQILQEPILGY